MSWFNVNWIGSVSLNSISPLVRRVEGGKAPTKPGKELAQKLDRISISADIFRIMRRWEWRKRECRRLGCT